MPAFGFLTSIEDATHGFFGGFLLLSERGRPLEFHCSTPVLPNSAQRILYGATLRSYVLCDLIGQALLAKASLPVQAVLTDQQEMLGLALLREEPIARVIPQTHSDTSPASESYPLTLIGRCLLEVSTSCPQQAPVIAEALSTLSSHVDLMEPFERVREAIAEARRLSEGPAEVPKDFSDAA